MCTENVGIIKSLVIFRSRTHTLRTQGIEPSVDDEISQGSDLEPDQEPNIYGIIESRTASPMMDGSDRVMSPHTQKHYQQMQSSLINISNASHSLQLNPQQYSTNHTITDKALYKPRFRNVSNSAGASTSGSNLVKDDSRTISTTTPNQVSSLGRISTNAIQPNQLNIAQRITKLIKENEQIVDSAKPPMPRGVKKFPSARTVVEEHTRTKLNSSGHKNREEPGFQLMKDNTKQIIPPICSQVSSIKNNVLTIQLPSVLPTQPKQSTSLLIEQYNPNQPLNLTKPVPNEIIATTSTIENPRKRSYSEGFSERDVANHPQNPEKSIIKDLLLNSTFGALSPSEADERFTCPFCKVSFRNAESLKYHTICYCQGSQANSPQSTSISPAASPSHGYYRSNSINDKYSPNSLAKLASTSLRRYPYKNESINQPSTLVQIVKQNVKLRRNVKNIVITPIPLPAGEGCSRSLEKVQAPLPSPGPFLGKTRLVDSYSNDKPLENIPPRVTATLKDNQNLIPVVTMPTTPLLIEHKFTLPEEVSPIKRTNSQISNRMYGGELLHRVDKKCEHFVGCGGFTGGSVTSLSPTSLSESEPSPISITPGYFSGGSVIQLTPVSKESLQKTPKLLVTMTPTLTPSNLTPSMNMGSPMTHFPYPPINPNIDYKQLALFQLQNESVGQAQTIYHGGKMIPFVPGIPGPNTSSLPPKSDRQMVNSPNRYKKIISPINFTSNLPSPNFLQTGNIPPRRVSPTPPRSTLNTKIIESTEMKLRTEKNGIVTTASHWSSAKYFDTKKVSRKLENQRKRDRSPDIVEIRHFNYDNVIAKSGVSNQQGLKQMAPLHIDIAAPVFNQPSITVVSTSTVEAQPQKSKFLRPSSLPLKPGTFIQKKHHGITPTQNTMPLISPETPRPSKNVIQLYQNGNAYTYLGLKVSTKMTFCTLSRCQPFFLLNRSKLLSMYSTWIVQDDFDPHPLGLSPPEQFGLYDSRTFPTKEYSIARLSAPYAMVHSQLTIMTPSITSTEFKAGQYPHHRIQQMQLPKPPALETQIPITSPTVVTVPGGYESNEDYTYVRGRGRGRYVCLECGIRCKKPSMLKKHIRTHTDVRPYTCSMCSFRYLFFI